MKWTIETGLVSREATDWIDSRYRGYMKGEVSEIAICGEMVQMYQRLREDELRRAAKNSRSNVADSAASLRRLAAACSGA